MPPGGVIGPHLNTLCNPPVRPAGVFVCAERRSAHLLAPATSKRRIITKIEM